MPRKGATPRLPVGGEPHRRGPLLWIALACVVMFLVGAALFALFGTERRGEPIPAPEPAGGGD